MLSNTILNTVFTVLAILSSVEVCSASPMRPALTASSTPTATFTSLEPSSVTHPSIHPVTPGMLVRADLSTDNEDEVERPRPSPAPWNEGPHIVPPLEEDRTPNVSRDELGETRGPEPPKPRPWNTGPAKVGGHTQPFDS